MYEISSDSEDDCYDKFPQKLQKLKTKHALTNPVNYIDLINSSTVTNGALNVYPVTKQNSDVIAVLDETNEIIDVEARSLTLNALDTPLEGVTTRSRRAKRKENIEVTSVTLPVSKRGRGRGRGRQNSIPPPLQSRGRGRGGRGAQQTSNIRTILSTPSPRRGRGRRRASRTPLHQSIVYSVGNTDEYPDASDHQELFSNGNKKLAPEVQALNTSIDLDESIDNEELSVKVYWQHSEVFKFNIRRLQKMTQIFDFFVNKEGVSRDRLFLTYNYNKRSNKILQPDDTPDSINYNIAKFIEGGIVNKEFKLDSKVESPRKKGFVIKFQCQSKKKPLELSLGKDEKLQIAMVKCAEELEVPIAKLLFEFDGETVPGNATPNDLEMESGDCIDVRIINVIK